MMRRGAAVLNKLAPKPRTDVTFQLNGGGLVSGELSENGMNDFKLGNSFEDGIKFSCCRVANKRKCNVV